MSSEKKENGNISHHILPTASTLLGICFVMLGYINVMASTEKTLLDEILAIAIALFFGATICSYLAMRSDRLGPFYERIADIIFLCGLGLLTVVALIFTFIISK
jgi:hypothetical protein